MLGSGGGARTLRICLTVRATRACLIPTAGRGKFHNAAFRKPSDAASRRTSCTDLARLVRASRGRRSMYRLAASRQTRSTLRDHFGRKTCSATDLATRGRRSLYKEAFQRSIESPRDFWAEQAQHLVWARKWDIVLDDRSMFFPKWFPGGRISVCYNAVDRHVEGGKGDKVAIIHDSPVTETVTKVTYKELQEQVSKVASVLVSWGVKKGDRVVIYMPMIPESVYGMLACSRIGAVHSLVFGGFAAKELAVRINHAQADVCLSANFGIEPKRTVPYKAILDEAIQISQHKPRKCLIYKRPGQDEVQMTPGRDQFWQDALASAKPVDCTPIDAMDPLYLLYTSGTTGLPKAVVRPAGGHAVNVLYTMYSVFGVKEEDTWWAASDLGWVVGHSYVCYGPLLKGVTTVLYEGKPVGTPDCGSYFRVIDEHGVCGMFSAPTAMRVLRKEDPGAEIGKKFAMKKLRNIFLAGERCDQETLKWAERAFRVPVLDNWWQTETGSPLTATCVGLGNSLDVPEEATGLPVPGWDVKILLDDGLEAAPHQLGNVAVKLPLPPGAFSTLHRADDVFVEKYFSRFPGYYDTSDTGVRHDNGYVSILSRNDDVINVAGHRLSASQLEEAIMKHEKVVECAVVGVPDGIKGEVPLALVVLGNGTKTKLKKVRREIVNMVRESVGPVAAMNLVNSVPALPKTRSGKIPRKTIADLARDKPVKIPVTIEDPSVYKALKAALQELGYARRAPDPR